ncbi:MAG: DUF87 domain-containing protein [Clostridiales bacterium]|nr:DUF87 domain-containing protein [Clostridiales bacterium]
MADFIRVQSGNEWRGVSIIRANSVPRALENPEALLRGLLDICLENVFSLEACFSFGGEDETFEALLILRHSFPKAAQGEEKVRNITEMVRNRLEIAGFRTAAVPTEEYGKLRPAVIFGGSGKPSGKGFYPAEAASTVSGIPVIPGCCAALKNRESTDEAEKGIWGKLLLTLSRYPGTLLSLQLIPTAMMPEETRLAEGCMAMLGSSGDKGAADALRRFDILCGLSGRPVFLMNLYAAGDGTGVRDIGYLLQGYGYASFDFHRDVFGIRGYLTFGDDDMSRVMNAGAHLPAWRWGKLARGWQRLSRIADTGTLARALCPDRDLESLPGFRYTRLAEDNERLPSEFMSDRDSVYLGQRESSGKPVYLPLKDLTRHGCVVGKPGSGKTVFFLGLLYRLYEKKVPFLVIEPVKTEYRCLKAVIPELQIYTPGSSAVSPMPLNLFLPPPGVTLGEYMQDVNRLFGMAFSMTSLLKNTFTTVIRLCYTKYGWRNESTRDSKGVTPFGLREFIREFRDYVREFVANQESRDNVENSGVLRLQKLLDENEDMFDTIRMPDWEKMLTTPTVIELDAITDSGLKSLVLGIILVNLTAVIHKWKDSGGKLRNMLLIDEAHVVLNPEKRGRDENDADPGAEGLAIIQNMVKVMRGPGVSLFFGDQSAARLTRDIFSDADIKLLFRLDNPDDRRMIADSTMMTEKMMGEMVRLDPGQGFFHCGKLEKPVMVQTPDSEKDLNLKKNMPDEAVRDAMHPIIPPPFTACAACGACAAGCDTRTRSDAAFLARNLAANSARVKEMLPPDPEKAEKAQLQLPAYLAGEFEEEACRTAKEKGIEWTSRLAACARIQMARELMMKPNCTLSESQLSGGEKPPKPKGGRPGSHFDR